ncbi:TetR/AcrR family transcriptional regulator C-terminal domain-containing protein [Nocardia crassostreae]|uniref:TetR/AcrR family transcriptional regulator C-terminal domain-containing protein n=1 Tax=Nocardia crassostreae TaxID=53428 RepID=UPI0009FE8EE2|nr:TetR/AcrR family transcriptional regulator C-terminal domain-containing protein [Nocardia crassostreae]
MTTQRPAKTRTPLNRERVLSAALGLADESGLDALSMRKLAQALGVEAMSLYNHVANKDDLLDGVADLVIGEFELLAAGGDWRAALRRRCVSAHETLLRHPWACVLIVARMNIGPNMLRHIDAMLGCLHEAGFSYVLADRAWNALDSHVYGFTLQELNFPFDTGEYASAAAGFLPQLPAAHYPHMRALTELVATGAHNGVADFEFGLDLLLDGLEKLRAAV